MHYLFSLQVFQDLHQLSSIYSDDFNVKFAVARKDISEVSILAVLKDEIQKFMVHRHPNQLYDQWVVKFEEKVLLTVD